MSRKRSEIEISADILRVARNGAKKSHIVYKANLNFKLIKKYLNRLEKAGLIIMGSKGEGRVFKTTERGAEYLDHFNGFKDYMSWNGSAFN